MTGRELIIYILSNNLEDKQVIENGKLIGFMNAEEVAVNIGTGVATVKALANRGTIEGYHLGNSLFIAKDVKIMKDPSLK